MTRFCLSLFFVALLALLAGSAQAQDYPANEADPAFQVAGYDLVIEDGFREAVRPWRSWAYSDVQTMIQARVNSAYDNLKMTEVWGGADTTFVIDVAYHQFPWGWYYCEGYRVWYYKVSGGGGGQHDPPGGL